VAVVVNEDGLVLDRAAPGPDGPASSDVLTIGFLNNMPEAAIAATERQFCRIVTAAASTRPIRLRPFSLSGPSAKYAGVDEICDAGLDGLIITGTEPRATDLRDEPFWAKLAELFDWAEANAVPTILSCLAAHAAVLHRDGIPRRKLSEKRFGVYDHAPVGSDPLLRGLGPSLRVPHSRWNELDDRALADCGYHVLTRSPIAGIDLFIDPRRRLFTHFQGHPEYEPVTLLLEFRRDVKRFLDGVRNTYPDIPVGYFDPAMEQRLAVFRARAIAEPRPELVVELPCTQDSVPAAAPWRDTAVTIYGNWLTQIGEQKAERRRALAVVTVPAEASDPAAAFAAIAAAAFERILACGPVGWDADFFDLGGDSILALAVMYEVEKVTGFALALPAFVEAPTARTLGQLLSERARPTRSALVLLKPGDAAAPIFLLQGVGDSVVELRALARAFDTPYAVYGIQARDLDGLAAPLDSVEAIAEAHAEEIGRIQPSGPYALIGFSVGGLVALELAQQLSQAGHKIALLALLDTFPHTRHWPLLCRLWNWSMPVTLKTSFRAWRRLSGSNEAAGPDDRTRRTALPVDLERVANAGRRAFREYRPRFYAGEIVFVEATLAARAPFHARLLWGGRAGKLTIRNIAADDRSRVNRDVKALASVVSAALRDAKWGTPRGERRKSS